MKETDLSIGDDHIEKRIYLVRDQRVMIDRDLASLYGVPTKALKQAVRRNMQRFPGDFMFQMNKKEFYEWRSQFVTSKSDIMGLRYAPFCFSEQGVTMLSCVLNSKRAIGVNIRIIRVFTRMRSFLLSQKEVLLKLEQLEKHVSQNNADIQMIFDILKQLVSPVNEPRRRIGFKLSGEGRDQIAVNS